MPLYAGPKSTSKAGREASEAAASEDEIVDAYAVQSVVSRGPVERRPALKKYGDVLTSKIYRGDNTSKSLRRTSRI
jgi:hypothetical protein